MCNFCCSYIFYQVLDEAVFLKDEEGAIEENVSLLPVCVMEVLYKKYENYC